MTFSIRIENASKNYVSKYIKDFDEKEKGVIPSMTMKGYNYNSLKNYLEDISSINVNSETSVIAYLNGATDVTGASPYSGSIYSPSQNYIYFSPRDQGAQDNWHYIDCDTGSVVAYTNIFSTTIVNSAYHGGAYSPTQNYIYFSPRDQGPQDDWHYIDCDTGSVVAYDNIYSTTLVSGAYSGGVYSPVHNRIYFVPYGQSSETTWHYVNCDTGAVVAYTNGATATATATDIAFAYGGGSYSPVQNRIYFTPYKQSSETTWHYVDCKTGDIVPYTHGATITNDAYFGSVYSPVQNRIYFVPFEQSAETSWHYVDCNTGLVVAYTHGADVVKWAYDGGVYSPTQNRIYFTPHRQGDETTWHYVDCDDGSVVAYTHVPTAVPGASYNGGSYSPTENRIYFVPRAQGDETTWHYLKPLTAANASISFSASTLMGN
jgi:hypothetical protein